MHGPLHPQRLRGETRRGTSRLLQFNETYATGCNATTRSVHFLPIRNFRRVRQHSPDHEIVDFPGHSQLPQLPRHTCWHSCLSIGVQSCSSFGRPVPLAPVIEVRPVDDRLQFLILRTFPRRCGCACNHYTDVAFPIAVQRSRQNQWPVSYA